MCSSDNAYASQIINHHSRFNRFINHRINHQKKNKIRLPSKRGIANNMRFVVLFLMHAAICKLQNANASAKFGVHFWIWILRKTIHFWMQKITRKMYSPFLPTCIFLDFSFFFLMNLDRHADQTHALRTRTHHFTQMRTRCENGGSLCGLWLWKIWIWHLNIHF